uniref:tRNA pseudouridine synthase n=1 Tax=Trichuris muris TaxID=70415 RepID=A0A5S6Q9J6_TRIMR
MKRNTVIKHLQVLTTSRFSKRGTCVLPVGRSSYCSKGFPVPPFHFPEMIFRYFLNFSYLGSRFAGCQIQPDNITVQGVLERSRHGLFVAIIQGTTLAAQQSDRFGCTRFNEHSYAAINTLLCKLEMEIRVHGCRTVSLGFDARRHARERTYLYRLAVLKHRFDTAEDYVVNNPEHQLPILECQRVWAVRSNFDIRRFRSAADVFLGWHNFASFMSKTRSHRGKLMVDTERSIKHIDRFDFFDINFVSKSFLYNQIRRMMTCLVAVASNRLEIQDIKWLLEHPNPSNYTKFSLRKAPSDGLYLKNISYDERDFLNPNPFICSYSDGTDSDENKLNDIDSSNIDE